MSRTLLITGAGPNGVTGKLIKEYFSEKYNILTPGSADLDLTDDQKVSEYFNHNKIDYVIHCATFRPSNTSGSYLFQDILESNLRMYFALANQSDRFQRMIYFGSGAEYAKTRNIEIISENDFGRILPKDQYGLGKYIMNEHCRKSDNIYNVRLFGTINPYESYKKNIISNLCVKAIWGKPLNLKRDCKFSFVDIADILPILDNMLYKDLKYHDYNTTMTSCYYLSDVAKIVKEIHNSDIDITFEKAGMNYEYTANNNRLLLEFNPSFSSIEKSIQRVYDYWCSKKDEIDIESIDNRWKNK